jgi:hypothetical protein
MLKVLTMPQEIMCCRIESPHFAYNSWVIVINVVNLELMHWTPLLILAWFLICFTIVRLQKMSTNIHSEFSLCIVVYLTPKTWWSQLLDFNMYIVCSYMYQILHNLYTWSTFVSLRLKKS